MQPRPAASATGEFIDTRCEAVELVDTALPAAVRGDQLAAPSTTRRRTAP